MKRNYLKKMQNILESCQKLRELVEKRYYKEDGSVNKRGIDGWFCCYPIYRDILEGIKRPVQICDFLGIKDVEEWKPVLDDWMPYLEDHLRLTSKANFEESLQVIENAFREVEDKIEKKLSILDSKEEDRLNEAIHCFLEGCYYSAIAMSVSAIESRLFSLMKGVRPRAKLKELTLGQLIREYLENKEEYSNVIPKKHEPLLEHCNIYRVFSVHPKEEEINKPIASSILNMTFMFLLDKKLARKSKSTSKKE